MGEMNSIFSKRSEANKNNSDLQTRRIKRSGSKSSSVNRILYLQRTIGNQAVSRLIRSKALQAKLRIGQPGDVYEQEADRVADEVMRMPEPGVQRQVEPEEEEEEILQTKPLVDQITPLVQRQVEEEEMLQAKNREDSTSEVTNDLELQINAIKGGGRPLAESERAFFEPRFVADFSRVRVHTGAQAAESAQAVNARAFTTGRDIVFGEGQYAPEATGGKKLLAHELTHVVQQNNFMDVSDKISTGNLRAHELIHTIKKSNISEQEADEVAKQVVNTINISSLQIAPSTAQRQEQSRPPPPAWTPSQLRDHLERLRSSGELLQGALEEPDKPNLDRVREIVRLCVEEYIRLLDEYVRNGGDLLDLLREIKRIPWPDDPPSREARDRLIRAIVEKQGIQPH